MGVLIGAVSGVSWIVIEVMTILNPTDTVPIVVPASVYVPVYLFSAVAAVVLPTTAIATMEGRFFWTRFVGSFVLLVGIAGACGAFIHRDFFAFTTTLILIYFTIFLYRIEDLGIVRNRAVVFPLLARAALVVFVLWVLWIMIMSYAIVSRAEPRWIESIAYNFTNGILGIVMLYVGTTLYERAKRTVRFRDGGWHLDERNVSALLSPQECRIVQMLFSHPGQPITCRGLIGQLYENTDRHAEALRECTQCLAGQWTASQCSTYRNVKNRIADTKKYLELLQIGTIVPVSENSRDIKELGWRLRVFEDVRIAPLGDRSNAGSVVRPAD
ncbi:MAG: hypothetical protein PF508_08600 [Spirochaeta sp.]|jgi:hypothetical protein|nr:hypothetical protein [Spirochaeta sp.]